MLDGFLHALVSSARSRGARTPRPHISVSVCEIYRFDINKNWRSGVRVMRRMRVN